MLLNTTLKALLAEGLTKNRPRRLCRGVSGGNPGNSSSGRIHFWPGARTISPSGMYLNATKLDVSGSCGSENRSRSFKRMCSMTTSVPFIRPKVGQGLPSRSMRAPLYNMRTDCLLPVCLKLAFCCRCSRTLDAVSGTAVSTSSRAATRYT